MRVVFTAAEAAPLAKVGGLADVVGSLPKALEKLGLKVAIILPKYQVIDTQKFPLELAAENLEVFFADRLEKFAVYKTLLPKSAIEVFLIDHRFFTNGVYLDPTATPKTLSEVKRFAFFSLAVLEFLEKIGANFDIIHLHDWHTALIPTLISLKFQASKLRKIATVLTIHNLGQSYQGIAKGKFLHSLDLEPEPVNFLARRFKNLKRLNIFKTLNFLEQGIKTADLLNTVSPGYAAEIKTREFGGKLARILQTRSSELYGILNGIDYEFFNPETDKNLSLNYNKKTWVEGKAANKRALEERLNFEKDNKILAGMVTRLDSQKGLDLVLSALPQINQMGVKLAILGKGSQKLEKKFGLYCGQNPTLASCTFKFDPSLANLIYAASDLFLMPSSFEPCGLGQMIAQRYGTIPVVRDVGGLHDTVEDAVTGFKFAKFTSKALLEALRRAVVTFQDQEARRKIVDRALTKDFSWAKSAAEYVKLYERALEIKSTENKLSLSLQDKQSLSLRDKQSLSLQDKQSLSLQDKQSLSLQDKQ